MTEWKDTKCVVDKTGDVTGEVVILRETQTASYLCILQIYWACILLKLSCDRNCSQWYPFLVDRTCPPFFKQQTILVAQVQEAYGHFCFELSALSRQEKHSNRQFQSGNVLQGYLI